MVKEQKKLNCVVPLLWILLPNVGKLGTTRNGEDNVKEIEKRIISIR